jgi:hypothetical protein
MSRLDRHVAVVQTKLTLSTLLAALAWSLLVYGVVVWVTILANKVFGVRLPRAGVWFFSGLGVSAAAAVAYALWHRPSRHEAAVAIDEKLQLKEKFSTALYVRPSSDPFAAAAVRDAEHTADNVSLNKQFPLRFPKAGLATVVVAALALLTTRLDAMDLFGVQHRKAVAAEQEKARVETDKEVKRALAQIEQAPQKVKDDEQIKVAKAELTNLMARPYKDPGRAKTTALKAIEDMESIRQKIKDIQNTAEAQNQLKNWRNNVRQPADDSGPVGKAHSAMAKGEFTEAINELQKAVKDFDKMAKGEQQKAARQMKDLADQLKQMAQDPQQQKQLEKKMQDLGANKQQAAQIAKMMQQAANGDKLAQQQLQQMKNQLMQQMNNGKGPTPQQQQQVNQAMQQMQAAANQQQQAAAMAQAAQQMAQAMGQQAQAAGGQGQPQQPGQGQQQGQQMANAQQQMQQMMQQMQAQQQAAQLAQAQAAAGQGQGGNGGNQPGQGKNGQVQWGNGRTQWGKGNPNNKGQGMGGPGIGAGGKAEVAEAPYDTVQEVSPGVIDEKGKIQHTSMVKAAALKGESKQLLSKVSESEMKELNDEVDTERIPRPAMKAVKEYFGNADDEAPAAPEPAKK